MTARAVLAKAMTEDGFLAAITEAMTLYGWRFHHVRRSDKALQMGHAGFPDVVAVRAGRVLFLELKAVGGTLTDDQRAWAVEMPLNSRGVTYYSVVFPADLDVVLEWLR